MVELVYVKKRKRKKAARIIAAIGFIGLAILILVSFLGRYTGSYTVSLDSGEVQLTLTPKKLSDDHTSYMRVDSLPAFDLQSFGKLPDGNELDNEETTYEMGIENHKSGDRIMYFFKHTFFVKNLGNVASSFNLSVNITKNEPSSDGRYLDTILRVMIFDNSADSDSHNYEVYAKKSETPNKTGVGDETTYDEYLSIPYDPSDSTSKAVFATPFKDKDTIATIENKRLESGDLERYTIVAWLEGFDQQAKGVPPEGGVIKLGVTINAYENKQ